MSLLSDDVYKDDWQVLLAVYISKLHTDPSQERFDTIKNMLDQHCEHRGLKCCWNKHRYIAICPPGGNRWANYKGAKVIIAADESLVKGHGYKTYVYKWTGPTGLKSRRAMWHKVDRGQGNPVLSSGYEFAGFVRYILPEETWGVLMDMLPKNQKDFPAPF